MNKKQIVATMIAGIVMRLIPHVPNLTPVGAISLFSGYGTKHRWYWITPLVIMGVSDYFLGFHKTIGFVYGSFVLIALLGRVFARRLTHARVIGLSLASSILFFAVTNLGVWLMGTMYTKDLSGLVQCYLYALPFLRMTIISDLLFNTVLYTAYSRHISNSVIQPVTTG